MKKLFTLLFLLLTFLGIEQSHAAKFSGLKSIQSGGTTRQYYLYVPDNLKSNRPLMISCHGHNQDYQYQMQQTQWPLVADTANFVVVYPVGIAGSAWNTSYSTGWDVEGMTDVNFMLDIINDVKANYHIDDTKVCISGFSLGGAFVYHCINKAADKFAVAAPISGYNPITTNTSCSRPVPIVHVHGTEDGTMPYDQVKNYLKRWAQDYGCNMTPEETQGNGYTKLRYKDGDLNSEVVLYSVTGRGHVPSNDGFHTSSAIWNFCKKYMLDNKPEKKKEFVVSKYGDLRIKDGYVADASGKKVSLMGPSLYWSCIEPLWWSRETVEYLVDKYNIQIIRLPVAIAPGPGGYGRTSVQYQPNTWNEDCYYYRPDYTKKLVDEVVEAAIENDIYVIIDFHEHYAEDWTYIACEFFSYFARKWGNYPNVLYEIYNEPVCDRGTVINYAKQVIPTIRAIDPDNIIIVGSPNYSREPHTVTDAGQGQSNIAYSWHGYVRYNHQSDWDSSEASSWNTSVPVIVTEWGVGNNKDDGGLLNLFKERGVINCFWSMSNAGGNEAAWSVLKESCNKKSGWTEADMTENGAFLLAQTKGWVDFKPVSLVDEPEDSPEVYTEFVAETGTLTYYYDDKRDERTGVTEVYDPESTRFTGYNEKVLEGVIDPSMKNAPLASMRNMFYNLSKMTNIKGIDNLNTTNVTNMRCMFYGCNALTSLNLSSFNTANVTNMSDMFTACFQLKSLDLSSFNTANVTNMGAMFSGCSSLTFLDLSSFNTQNVTNMVDMFGGCYSLTSLDVSSLNTENVTNMWAMFSGCSSLTSLDLSSFNTQNVTTMERMFFGCYSLTSLDVSSFNTENVTNMDRMFFYCKSLTSLDLSSFNTQKVTEMVNMFDNCLSLKTIFCNDDWGKSSVLEYSKDMFSQCGSLVGGRGTKWTSDIIDARYARPDGGTSQPGYFTKYGAEVYTEFVAETGTLTYYYDDKREERTGVTELYDPVENSSAVRFTGYNDKVVKAVIDPSMKNAPLTSTNGMFYGNMNSETIKIQSLYNMTTIEGLWNLNTAIITDMESMFFSCSALTMLDLSSFNTSKVTNMNGMFLGCNKLEVVDVSSFDISNVTDLYMMFSGCTKLKTIYCSNDWSTSSARSGYMFSVCNSLVGGKGTVFDSKVIDNTYARPDGGESAPGYFTDDSLTGIKKVQDVQKVQGVQENIYNLSGQRVNKPVQKGLYIINGKKMMVK